MQPPSMMLVLSMPPRIFSGKSALERLFVAIEVSMCRVSTERREKSHTEISEGKLNSVCVHLHLRT